MSNYSLPQRQVNAESSLRCSTIRPKHFSSWALVFHLWTRAQSAMLSHEDVSIQAGDPSFALDGHAQETQSVADIRLNCRPEEFWIALDQVGRRGQPHLFRHTGFVELMEKCIQLAGVVGIAQLTNEIG